MTDELRCPWCGGPADTSEIPSIKHHIRCLDIECGFVGPWRPTREEAVATLGDVLPTHCRYHDKRERCPMANRSDRAEAALAELREERGAWCAFADEMAALLADALAADYRPDCPWCDKARAAVARWKKVRG